jgi:prevent-host-death family protein
LLDQFGQISKIVVMPKKPAMVSEPVSLYDAKTRLSELVDLAAQGREFVIAKSGKPKARLVPFARGGADRPRKPGGARGRVWIAADFDAPLPAAVLRAFGEAPG